MKIGILTFHWATNYGAILQTYCLQEYLKSLSCEVEIINYKPLIYDSSIFSFLKHPSNWLQISKYPKEKKKESLLVPFREKYLTLTERLTSIGQISHHNFEYDIIISGSDQVLNPFFTTQGEGVPTSTYYLPFGKEGAKKIGYAVSFGCETYPEYALKYAKEWINNFCCVGTRETTGINILQQMSFKGESRLVPDPTILMGKELFNKLNIEVPKQKKDYVCVYMLRHEIKLQGEMRYIDEVHCPLSMEEWLQSISMAKALVTNSYHGMIVAILANVPFVAIMEKKKIGMNDRFNTLLSKLSLSERIVYDECDILSTINRPINWDRVNNAINLFSQEGKDFLSQFVNK